MTHKHLLLVNNNNRLWTLVRHLDNFKDNNNLSLARDNSNQSLDKEMDNHSGTLDRDLHNKGI